MATRSMSASGGNADVPDNPHQCPLMTHCGYGGATSQLAVPDFSFTPMSGFSPEACFRTYISGAFWDRSLILERFQVRCQRADGCADSDERTTFCPAAWQGQGCKNLRIAADRKRRYRLWADGRPPDRKSAPRSRAPVSSQCVGALPHRR